MRKILALLLMLVASPALGQSFPPNMPANSVWGRLGIGTGPGQAIPFATLAPRLNGAIFDTANIWSQPQTFRNIIINPPAPSTVQGFTITQSGSVSGTVAGPLPYNSISIFDGSNVTGIASTTAQMRGVSIIVDTGGANSGGDKIGLYVRLNHSIASNATLGRDNIALGALAFSNTSEGGTGTGVSTSKGTLFGESCAGVLSAGATNYFSVACSEDDVAIYTGASAYARFGRSLISAGDLQAASQYDAALEVGGAGLSWKMGLMFSSLHGTQSVGTTGTLIGTDAVAFTALNGVDFSAVTFTNYAFRGPNGFSVSGGADIAGKNITLTSATNSPGVTVTDGTVTGTIRPSSNLSNSILIGTTSNHALGFLTNNTVTASLQGAIFYAGTAGGAGSVNLQGAAGAIGLLGTGSGTVTITTQAAAGTYNFNLPTTAGTSGQVLTSAGGVSAVMTWTTPPAGTVTSIATTAPITGGTITTTGTIACATCVTGSTLTANQIVVGANSQAIAVIPTGTGVVSALGVNVGSAGAFITFNGALGTPSSGVGTNITGVNAAQLGGATFAAPGAIGGGTPAAGTFTVLTGTSGSITGLGTLAIRDTSAAFDVTIAATSSGVLTAGRALTLNMGNVAHTLAFGTTANTITFPNVASDTVGMLATAQTWTGVNTYSTNSHYSVVGGAGAGFWLATATTGADRFFFGSDATIADDFRIFSTLLGQNIVNVQAAATVNASLFTLNAGFAVSSTTDATSTSTGAITNIGGMSVNKRVWFNGLTTAAGFLAGGSYMCQSSAGEVIADTVSCLASSARVKQDFNTISDKHSLAMALAMQPKSWRYKPISNSVFPSEYYRERIGFIAEDLASIDERLVALGLDGNPRADDYMAITTVQGGAIRALKADNDNLRAEIEQLKRANAR